MTCVDSHAWHNRHVALSSLLCLPTTLHPAVTQGCVLVRESLCNCPEQSVPCLMFVSAVCAQNLDDAVLDAIDEALDNTDLLLIVGTSSVVYPAAGYAPQVAQR